MEISKELVKKAYKKLKSSVYYDKTQLVLRNSIVRFEHMHSKKGLEAYFKKLSEVLKDEKRFHSLSETICDKISVTSLPKKIESNDSGFFINSTSNEIEIKELQHYIDMPVEGHILGIIWIMLIGYKIDASVYEHSYGNRIRKKLINEFTEEPTYSPYLFEPYFEQYESWRDKAMSEAHKHMSQKQDVVIITMDFRRYYYSLDVDDLVLDELFNAAILDSDEEGRNDEFLQLCKRLNDFVGKVIFRYSLCFGDLFDERCILPIGFLPSNILGNWCLHKFDKAIVDGWNPVYYGRYVDDILIVDKIERNSEVFCKAKKNELTKDDIIDYLLTSCSKWDRFGGAGCKNSREYAVLIKKKESEATASGNSNDESLVYEINPRYNPCERNQSKIIVHNKKVKAFYFTWDESDALLTCFKKNISKNKSEFRHLPEDEAVFQHDDYSDIYSLDYNDTVNKLRGINGVEIDKYELSKFLGKYLRIGGMIRDKVESRFERDILKIFNTRAIIENYSMWEKIIEILIINERFEALEDFCVKINKAIESVSVTEEGFSEYVMGVKNALYIQLHASLCRNLGLVWKKSREEVQNRIYKAFLSLNIDDDPNVLIRGYMDARMIDKSVLPIVYDMLEYDSFNNDSNINLTRFNDVITRTRSMWDSHYKYFPYLIGMYDFDLVSCVEAINKGAEGEPFDDLERIYEEKMKRYISSNYCIEGHNIITHEAYGKICISALFNNKDEKNTYYGITVGDEKKQKIRIAIANVKLNPTSFERIVKGYSDRSYTRYKDLSQIVNLAIDQKADMLIMPEAYVPFEWLSTIARTCAKNKMAIITGVEHIELHGKVYNYTAVILPYLEDIYKCAHISFHLKKHYAPSEIEKIEGYRLTPVRGNNYELYKWNDCYFPVYCCYELASISDRSRFQSYADMIVAVEWNRDVKYYSNILESLSRDIHCYCIQVNSSEYGDSRITKPSKSEEKDIIRTKGGINSSILLEDIDIMDLRNFQIKEYSLQQKDSTFKTTPPNFDKNIVLKKIKGEVIFE